MDFLPQALTAPKPPLLLRLSVGANARAALILTVTVILSVSHAGQSIIFSHGKQIPGDFGDARLVNLILEHDYRSMLGESKFLSPAQFYPTKGTLVYSDNHLGTFLPYALVRWLGASRETAFQGWILLLLAANTACLLFLLRRIGVRSIIAGPAAFFGSSSSMLLFKMGHPQILPIFPFILMLSGVIAFLQSAEVKHLAAVALISAYQSLCYLYYWYFSLLIFFPLLVIAGLLFVDNDFWRQALLSLRRDRRLCAFSVVLALGITVCNLSPYFRFSERTGTHSIEELADLAPNPGAWLSSSTFSVFYHSLRHHKPGANIGENTLFAGGLVWLLMAMTLLSFIRLPKDKGLRLGSVLILTALLEMAFVTTWHGRWGSAYLWTVGQIQAVRAFRAFPRIGYLLVILETVSVALFLEYLIGRSRGRLVKVAVIALALALPFDGLALGQASYSKAMAQKRGQALTAAWQRTGGRRVLVFAPGFTNQPVSVINTDCWQAAMDLGRASVNGYSGNAPAGYQTFLQIPTLKNAHTMVENLHLASNAYSLVTDWLPEDKQELGILTYSFELKGKATPTSSIRDLFLRPLEEVTVPVDLENRELENLQCEAMRIFLSYRIYDDLNRPIALPESLRTAIKILPVGMTRGLLMRIQAPARKGIYEAHLSLVQESVAWWDDLGAKGSKIRLHVQ